MLKFTDMKNKEWCGKLTLGVNERLADEKVFDFLAISEDPESYSQLITNRRLQAKVIWAIVGPKEYTKEEYYAFADAIDGEVFAKARVAFLEEVQNFIRDEMNLEIEELARKSVELRKQILKQTSEKMTYENVGETLEQMMKDPDLIKKIMENSTQPLSSLQQPAGSTTTAV